MPRAGPRRALIDGEAGAHDVAVPDGTAMGATIDEATENGTAARSEGFGDRVAAGLAPPGPRTPEALRAAPTSAEIRDAAPPGPVPLRLDSGRPVRVDVALDAGALAGIDSAARARGRTRSACLVSAARDEIQAEG